MFRNVWPGAPSIASTEFDSVRFLWSLSTCRIDSASSVDTRTEMLIQEALDKLMENKTSFVVAHRLSTVRNADKIIVVDEGQIVEQGRHEELIAKGYESENSSFLTLADNFTGDKSDDSFGVGVRLRNLIQGLFYKFLSVRKNHSFGISVYLWQENIPKPGAV